MLSFGAHPNKVIVKKSRAPKARAMKIEGYSVRALKISPGILVNFALDFAKVETTGNAQPHERLDTLSQQNHRHGFHYPLPPT